MLTWNWDKIVGTCDIKQGERTFTLNLRNGNALLIAHYEYTNPETGKEMGDLQWFFCDEEHMKNMLGLNPRKGFSENTLEEITKLRLNKAKCRDLDKIVKAFTKAFDNITIEIYKEE